MKKIYELPEIDITLFETEELMLTSGVTNFDDAKFDVNGSNVLR